MHLNSIHLQVQSTVLLINGPTATCVDSCSSCMLPLLHACLQWLLFDLSFGKRTVRTTTTMIYICATSHAVQESVLTALDVNSASGVVLSQRVLHHTCVIPRILQFCSADLDSGVFPVGDNTCTAESGESGQGGNSMETQQVETWGTER